MLDNTDKKSKKSRYDMEYIKKNKDKITVLVPKGTKDVWKARSEFKGMSMNAFIIYCVEKEIYGNI